MDNRICDCGQGDHHEGASYYVSARDAGRTALLAGPFATHTEALDLLDRTRRAAQDSGDPRAHWYSYGSLAMRDGHSKPGVLNATLGVSPTFEPSPAQPPREG